MDQSPCPSVQLPSHLPLVPPAEDAAPHVGHLSSSVTQLWGCPLEPALIVPLPITPPRGTHQNLPEGHIGKAAAQCCPTKSHLYLKHRDLICQSASEHSPSAVCRLGLGDTVSMQASIRLEKLELAGQQEWLPFMLLAEPLTGEEGQKLGP